MVLEMTSRGSKRAAGVAASLPPAVQYTYNFERSNVAVAGPVSGGSVTQTFAHRCSKRVGEITVPVRDDFDRRQHTADLRTAIDRR